MLSKNCLHGDLLFHIKTCSTSKEAWDKLEQLYGKVDEEKGFQIKDDLLLDPKNYDTIQDYIIKVNEYRSLLKDFGNPIKDDRLIHHILKRLPTEYSNFRSYFYQHICPQNWFYSTP